MDDTMIARHLENLDHRLARVEQILPTLATKEELRLAIAPLATRADLKAFATRADLKAFATRADLEAFATKADLEALATREEIRDLRRHMDIVAEALRSDIQLIAEHLASVMPRSREG